jgi:hypothetical protein
MKPRSDLPSAAKEVYPHHGRAELSVERRHWSTSARVVLHMFICMNRCVIIAECQLLHAMIHIWNVEHETMKQWRTCSSFWPYHDSASDWEHNCDSCRGQACGSSSTRCEVLAKGYRTLGLTSVETVGTSLVPRVFPRLCLGCSS